MKSFIPKENLAAELWLEHPQTTDTHGEFMLAGRDWVEMVYLKSHSSSEIPDHCQKPCRTLHEPIPWLRREFHQAYVLTELCWSLLYNLDDSLVGFDVRKLQLRLSFLSSMFKRSTLNFHNRFLPCEIVDVHPCEPSAPEYDANRFFVGRPLRIRIQHSGLEPTPMQIPILAYVESSLRPHGTSGSPLQSTRAFG